MATKNQNSLRRVLRRDGTSQNPTGRDIPRLTFNWEEKKERKMCMRLGANCVCRCTFKISHEPEVFLPCSNFSLITAKQPFFLNHSPKGRVSKAEGSAVHSHLNFSLNMIPAELDIGSLPPPFLIWVRQLQKRMHAQARRLSPRHSAKTFPKVNLINLTFKGLLLPF